jgi:hypothetical protein
MESVSSTAVPAFPFLFDPVNRFNLISQPPMRLPSAILTQRAHSLELNRFCPEVNSYFLVNSFFFLSELKV